jgi:hypothetical protein
MVKQEIDKVIEFISMAEGHLRMVYDELDPESIIATDIEIALGRLVDTQYMLEDVAND